MHCSCFFSFFLSLYLISFFFLNSFFHSFLLRILFHCPSSFFFRSKSSLLAIINHFPSLYLSSFSLSYVLLSPQSPSLPPPPTVPPPPLPCPPPSLPSSTLHYIAIPSTIFLSPHSTLLPVPSHSTPSHLHSCFPPFLTLSQFFSPLSIANPSHSPIPHVSFYIKPNHPSPTFSVVGVSPVSPSSVRSFPL